jgi:phage replication O-like protein O
MNNEINGTGFTAVNNKLLEAIISRPFSLREIKILFTVIRYTFGFRRDNARLSLRFISRATGIDFSNANKTIAALIRKNVLSALPGATQNEGRNISLQVNYNDWLVGSSRNNHSSQIDHSSQNGNYALVKTTTETVAETTTKKEINKENINKVFSHWNSKNIINTIALMKS